MKKEPNFLVSFKYTFNLFLIMEEPKQIFKETTEWFSLMGCKCNKFLGSATIQTIRSHLAKKGFNISQRNVYIQNIPNELDLLILDKGVNNKMLVYEPEEVLAILEIKFRGSFGKSSIESLKKVYEHIKQIDNIPCLYVTLLEGKTYKNKITKENSGWNTFDIFYYKGDIMKGKKEDTGDWYKLIKYIQKIYG